MALPLVGSLAATEFIDHGDPNLICTAATPWSAFLFFLVNFLAHCATVKSHPAETAAGMAVAVTMALFIPSSGILRALDALFRHSRFSPGNELQKAARAGALCMVVRDEYSWVPRDGDVLTDVTISGERWRRRGPDVELGKTQLAKLPCWSNDPILGPAVESVVRAHAGASATTNRTVPYADSALANSWA